MSAQPVGPLVAGPDARRPQPMTLDGDRVRLTPPRPAQDAADLFAATHGPEHQALWTYLTAGPFADEAAFAADFAVSQASAGLAPFTIRDRATDRAVGRASFMRIEPAHRSIEVGAILFSPALARSAAATEAMFLMARHAFEDLGYRRYEWKCDALNALSRAAALRLGFRFEGVFTRHMIVKGRSRDTAWFAITDDEWPRVKAALQAWLAPDNFGPDGRQIARLADLRG